MKRLRAVSPFPFALYGGIAQLARASALQAEGLGFESPCLQTEKRVFLQILAKEPEERYGQVKIGSMRGCLGAVGRRRARPAAKDRG